MTSRAPEGFAALSAPFDRYPLAREVALAALAFGALRLAVGAVSAAGAPLVRALRDIGQPVVETGTGHLAVSHFASTAVILGGMTVVAAAYVRVRDPLVPVALPGRGALPLVAAAAAGPALALAAAALAGDLTGTPFYELSGSRSAPGSDFPAVVVLLKLSLALPAYLLVAHAVVQSSLRAAGDETAAAALTTLFVGLVGPTSLVQVGPPRSYALPVMLALAVALPACAAHWYDRRWLTATAAVPLALLAVAAGRDWLFGIAGPAGALFAGAEVLVVALGAVGVARTDSVVPAALAFTAYLVTREVLSHVTSGGVLV